MLTQRPQILDAPSKPIELDHDQRAGSPAAEHGERRLQTRALEV